MCWSQHSCSTDAFNVTFTRLKCIAESMIVDGIVVFKVEEK